jgi:integrase
VVDSGRELVTLGYIVPVYCYIRKGSRFFWLKYQTARGQAYESSKVDVGDPNADYKLAKKINKIEARLLLRHSGSGWDWVPAFFQAHYANSRESLRIHHTAWNWISTYFREREIVSPDTLTRAQVMDYIEWRTTRQKEKSHRYPARNTALYEIRVLGRVMREAVLRQMAETNPAAELGLKRDPQRIKPEITVEQQETILAALNREPRWMLRSFRIALQTGLRFSETIIDLERNFDRQRLEITVPTPKGGEHRAFTFAIMQTSLVPFLEGIRERYTWQRSEIGPTPAGVIWRRFFDRLDMPDISFHCTRTTFITWCYRQYPPIPREIVKQLVNHADDEIHRVYQRLNVSDAHAWRDRVSDPLGYAKNARGSQPRTRQ